MLVDEELDAREQNRAKYRELAEHAREMLLQQQARFARVDEKASRQLSATTVILGAFAFIGKWAVDHVIPPAGPAEWCVLVTGVLCLGLAVAAFWKLLDVIKHHKIPFLPMHAEYLEFVRANNRTDVNYHLADTSTKALDLLVKVTHEKADRLASAYRCNLGAIVALVLLALS